MRKLHRAALVAALPVLLLTVSCSSGDDSSDADATAAPTVAASGPNLFPQPDGSCPADRPVKAYETPKGKRVFITADEAGYAGVRPAFCFASPAAAKSAGFTKAG